MAKKLLLNCEMAYPLKPASSCVKKQRQEIYLFHTNVFYEYEIYIFDSVLKLGDCMRQ